MGTYMYDANGVYNILKDALDNIEGDFTRESLKVALDKLRAYPHTCD